MPLKRFLGGAFAFVWLISVSEKSDAVDRYRYYDSGLADSHSSYALQLDSVTLSQWIETRCALAGNKEGKEKAWSLSYKCDGGDSVRIVLKWGNTAYATDYDVRYLRISAYNRDSLLATTDITRDVDLLSGYNSLGVYVRNRRASIYVGNRTLKHVLDISVSGNPQGEAIVSCDDRLLIQRAHVHSVIDNKMTVVTEWTLEKLKDYIRLSDDPLEAFWSYLDRENDPSLAVLGGRYVLASIKSEGGYDLLYVDGAKTNAHRWKAGMLKGHMLSTVFGNNYDLLWYDAMIEPMTAEDELNAAISDDGMILTLSFPLLGSRLRFAKVRNLDRF